MKAIITLSRAVGEDHITSKSYLPSTRDPEFVGHRNRFFVGSVFPVVVSSELNFINVSEISSFRLLSAISSLWEMFSIRLRVFSILINAGQDILQDLHVLKGF